MAILTQTRAYSRVDRNGVQCAPFKKLEHCALKTQVRSVWRHVLPLGLCLALLQLTACSRNQEDDPPVHPTEAARRAQAEIEALSQQTAEESPEAPEQPAQDAAQSKPPAASQSWSEKTAEAQQKSGPSPREGGGAARPSASNGPPPGQAQLPAGATPITPAGENAPASSAAGGSGLGHVPPGKPTGNAPAIPSNQPLLETLPDKGNDDIVARQLREAANRETDPVLRRKLQDEYRKYKGEQP